MDRLLTMYNEPAYKDHLWIANKPKPVLIIRTDGGPDQNVRMSSTIKMYYNLWKILKLDMILVSMSAPGCSAFNEVERRMCPLSKCLVGVVIDHKKLGNHLDPNGKTIDEELERENFKAAGGILAGLWNDAEIDSYKVKSEYIEPISKQEKEAKFDDYDEIFADKHFKHGHFHFSIMKCKDRTCCSEYSQMHMIYKLSPLILK